MTAFNKEFDIVYLYCFDTTKELGYIITYENLTEGRIRFETKSSFWSFGEKFEIKLKKIDEKNTDVEFNSSYNNSLQLFDFVGKNRDNEEKFFTRLKELLNK
jgi:hypothetical protein